MAEKRAKNSQTTPQPTKKSPEQINERVGMEADHVYVISPNHAIFMTDMHLEVRELDEPHGRRTNQMRDQYGLNVAIESNGISTRFENTLRILLLHAVREALFNVVKHAETLNAEVTVNEKDGQIQLAVIDQGNGFDVQTALKNPNKRGGLMNIGHRLSLMGCNLQISSNPGQGTHVIIDIPKQQQVT